MNHLARLASAQREAFLARGTPLPPREGVVRPLPIARRGRPALIAEFKRSSPSHGAFAGRELGEQIRRYEALGAGAVSVLVAGAGFGGSVEDVRTARRETALPLLYKGFVTHPGQIDEAYAYGADAVLLIAALLGGDLSSHLAHAEELGLTALCEVHDARELEAAVAAGARLIGVNNRDLRTLEVDTERFLRLAPTAPNDALLVAESGYRTQEAVRRAARAGAHALLIGEALLSGSELQRPWQEVLGDVG